MGSDQRWDEDIGRSDHVSRDGCEELHRIALPVHMSRDDRAVRTNLSEDAWRTFRVISG